MSEYKGHEIEEKNGAFIVRKNGKRRGAFYTLEQAKKFIDSEVDDAIPATRKEYAKKHGHWYFR